MSVINFVFFQILNCTTFDAGKKAGFLLVIKMHKCANVQLNMNPSLWWIIISLIASQITYLIAHNDADCCLISAEYHKLNAMDFKCAARGGCCIFYITDFTCVCVCAYLNINHSFAFSLLILRSLVLAQSLPHFVYRLIQVILS